MITLVSDGANRPDVAGCGTGLLLPEWQRGTLRSLDNSTVCDSKFRCRETAAYATFSPNTG